MLSTANRPTVDILSHSPDQTRTLAAHLARLIAPGSLLLLSGDVGSGKTTFVQGFGRALGIDDAIQSPTFTIVSEYATTASGRLFHVDLYRIEGGEALDSIGLDEYLDDPEGIVVVEWPERAPSLWPPAFLLIAIEPIADTKRRLRFTPYGSDYVALAERFRSEVAGRG